MTAIQCEQMINYATGLIQEIAIALNLNVKVVFRNRLQSQHFFKPDENDLHVLIFGIRGMEIGFRDGFLEYKRWGWLWGKWDITGIRSVWALVIHEIAHAIQTENGERKYRSVHNLAWAQHVIELQERFPMKHGAI